MIVDYEKGVVAVTDNEGNRQEYPFASAEAFREISKQASGKGFRKYF